MTWLSIILGLLLIVLVILLYNQPAKKGMPPGPRGLPLVGNLFDLLKCDSIEFFSKLSTQYGAICSVQLGFRRVVVLGSQESLSFAFVRHGDASSDRPRGTVMSFIGGGRGIVMSEGQKWKDLRRLTLQMFKQFGMANKTISNYITLEVNTLMSCLKTKVNRPYDIRNDLATSILNIVWHMFVGKRFKLGDALLNWMIVSLDKTVTLIDQGGFLNFTPVLQFIGTFVRPRAFQVFHSLVYRVFHTWTLIAGHRRSLDDPGKQHDLIYAFLQQQNKLKMSNQPLGSYTDTELVWLLSDLFIAGLDTTVSALRWCLLFLVRRPDVARRIHEELDAVVGRDRTPCLEDQVRMPYLEAFCSEVLRYSSVVPIVCHANRHAMQLGPYTLPPDTMIIANIWGIHHDKKVWGDPEVFRPERFLDSRGEYVKNKNLVPFSLGRRNCVGEPLARAELFLVLSTLLQSFQVLPCGKIPSSRYVYGIMLHPQPYKIVLHARCQKEQITINSDVDTSEKCRTLSKDVCERSL